MSVAACLMQDRNLETHVDSSEVTLNICLGGDFRGGLTAKWHVERFLFTIAVLSGGVYFHGLDNEEGPPDPMVSPHPVDCKRCRATHVHREGTAIVHLGALDCFKCRDCSVAT